jgi:signal transduction histidine kinase
MRELGKRLRALGQALAAPALGEAERAHVAANLRRVLWAGVLGAAVAGAATVLAARWLDAAGLTVLGLALLGALRLLARGKAQLAAVLALAATIAAVHFILLLGGEGIHHRAVLLYPVIVLVAALLLDPRLLAATTALCALSAVIVARLEDMGRVATPFSGRLGWLPLVDLPIVLVATAVAMRALVTDVVRGMIAARENSQRLAAANRELESRSAELERFTYVVSHDLKSPLVTIRGFLGYVEQSAREGDLARLEADMARIRNATDRMGRLLDDLLELSRTGRIARPHVDVAFLEIVREAWGLVEGRLGARGVTVEVEGPLPSVRGDPQRLVELMQNLLDNAAKFTGNASEPRVLVGCRGQGPAEVVLFVRDNGIGIEPAHHQRIFELFQRLDPEQEGTGLGLALARRIVETHGGRIWVESEGAGRGSTFCFTLRPAAGGAGGTPVDANAQGATLASRQAVVHLAPRG